MSKPLLQFTDSGIYCDQGDFFIDPWKPVDRAIITHGHADHARWGSRHYLCHDDSVAILKHRLGEITVEGTSYGKKQTRNGVTVSLHPAGHLLGSAQVRVSYKGEVWVASGDYKIEPDPIAEEFEAVQCNTFITECTFGLPVFKWPDPVSVFAEIHQWWRQNQAEGKISIIGAYSLGKAQRVLAELDDSIGKVFVHGAVDGINQIHRKAGLLQKEIKYLSGDVSKQELEGSLVVAPPGAIGSSWINKLKPYSIGAVSGWMMMRGSKRRQNVDRGFVLSDHADWDGLNKAVKATGAENIICTHGYTDVFAKWLCDNGFNGRTEQTQFEGESLEQKEDRT